MGLELHAYLYGCLFTLIAEHKPLASLFSEHRAVPTQSLARIQCWALTLAYYEYTLEARPTNKHGNTDAMSRLPLKVKSQETPQPPEFVLLLDTMSEAPITCSQIQAWTRQDTVLASVLRYTQFGWPQHCPKEEMKPFWSRKNELVLLNGCILWGCQVEIPKAGRTQLLNELHNGHPGISRMKTLAHTVMWWPGIEPHQWHLYNHWPGQPNLGPIFIWT